MATMAPSSTTTPAKRTPSGRTTTVKKDMASSSDASRLAELPEELVSNIAARLGCDDFCSLRLTCVDVEEKSFHEFATEYFSEKCFMITTESLKVLVGIANSDRLRRYLHHVNFITACFPAEAMNCPNGCKCAWQPTVRQSEAWKDYMRDQETLKQTNEDIKMVHKAFKNLPAMKSLTLVDSPNSLKPGVDCRGKNRVWRATGRSAAYAPDSGVVDKEYDRWQGRVWKVMLHALSASGQSTVESLVTKLERGPMNGLSITNDLKVKQLKGLARSLASLTTLRLYILGKTLPKKKKSKLPDTEKGDEILQDLAAAIPSLDELILHLDPSPGSVLINHSLVNQLNLSKLSTLTLNSMCTTAEALSVTVRSLNSVKRMSLQYINLSAGHWVVILKHIRNLTALEHLHLMYLSESGRKTYFLKQKEPETDDVDGMAGGFGDYDDAYDSLEDDDESLPDLEPADVHDGPPGSSFDNPIQLPPGQATVEVTHSTPEDPKVSPNAEPDTLMPCGEHGKPDHIAPGHEMYHERGYYVCIHGDQIAQQLPIFIQQYNLGDDLGSHGLDDVLDLPFPGGPGGGGPGFNNFLSALMATAPPGFGVAQGGGPHVHAPVPPTNHGAGVQHGNIPPLGNMVTMGIGPMVLGSFPLPGPTGQAGLGASNVGQAPQPAGAGNTATPTGQSTEAAPTAQSSAASNMGGGGGGIGNFTTADMAADGSGWMDEEAGDEWVSDDEVASMD